MAQTTQVVLTCDLEETEKPAKETVEFSVDGTAYEMELCERHAEQLRDGLAPSSPRLVGLAASVEVAAVAQPVHRPGPYSGDPGLGAQEGHQGQ